jgi:nitrogenase iron protein
LAKLKKVAIYGKGGIGKSTVSSNVSAAASHMGETVLQVGCDPKRDSIATLCGKLMPTICDQVREGSTNIDLDKVIFKGYNGIWGCESGGPKPGTGCAGRGVNLALNLIDQFKIIERYGITFALYDVLGDVVCGGFAQPMRAGHAREIYLVTCGEILTMYQVNNISRAVKRVHDDGADIGIAGIINNQRGLSHETEIVEDFAELIGVPVVAHIPRSRTVQDAEFLGKTVIEVFPDSEQAQVYRQLARRILDNEKIYIPEITNLGALKEILGKYPAATMVAA